MTFHLPVYVGDVLCVYADVERIGRSSMTLSPRGLGDSGGRAGNGVKVTEGSFTFVAIDDRPAGRARCRQAPWGGRG